MSCPVCITSYQSEQPICVEDKVCLVGVDIAYDGMHAPDLIVAGDDLQVVEDPAQIWLL